MPLDIKGVVNGGLNVQKALGRTWFNTEKQNSTPDCRSVLSMGGDLAAHFGSEMISRRTDTMPARTIRSSLAAP